MNRDLFPSDLAACENIVAEMAKTLVKYNATANERDAIRCLMGRGFRNGDVALWSDQALEKARGIERAAIAAARANDLSAEARLRAKAEGATS
jgi:hypothetical protein